MEKSSFSLQDLAFSNEAEGDFLYETVLRSTIVGISYMVGRRFVWANEHMHSIFGYSNGELLGKSVRVLYSSQADYDEVGRRYRSHDHESDFTHERPLVRKDGTLIWCLMSGQLLDPAQANDASVWVVQDITGHKSAVDALKRTNQRLEQIVERRTLNLRRTNHALRHEIERRNALQLELVESREKYRALFRYLPVGVLVTNRAGEIVEINRATQNLAAARSRTELMHLIEDKTRIVQDDGNSISMAQFVRLMSPTERRTVERSHIMWRSNSGKLRELSMIATALSVHGLGAIFTFEDITEVKQARAREHEQHQQLAHAARLSLMGQIASAMAHELGQPLNACQSYISGIRHRLGSELHDKPELLEAIDRIALHLNNASDIIGNVRGFVSRHHIEQQDFDLKVLLSHTLVLLDMHLKLKGIRVAITVTEDDLKVHGNYVEIQQVIVNLVMNAIEAMEGIPETERRLSINIGDTLSGHVFFEVQDYGPGISSELAARIFEPYFTTKTQGLGMGLKICRNIIESAGGALRFFNEDAGARFRFTLPRLVS